MKKYSKSLKSLLLMLLIVPCVLVFTACGAEGKGSKLATEAADAARETVSSLDASAVGGWKGLQLDAKISASVKLPKDLAAALAAVAPEGTSVKASMSAGASVSAKISGLDDETGAALKGTVVASGSGELKDLAKANIYVDKDYIYDINAQTKEANEEGAAGIFGGATDFLPGEDGDFDIAAVLALVTEGAKEVYSAKSGKNTKYTFVYGTAEILELVTPLLTAEEGLEVGPNSILSTVLGMVDTFAEKINATIEVAVTLDEEGGLVALGVNASVSVKLDAAEVIGEGAKGTITVSGSASLTVKEFTGTVKAPKSQAVLDAYTLDYDAPSIG